MTMEDNKNATDVSDIVRSLTASIPRGSDLTLSEYRGERLALELYRDDVMSLDGCASVAGMTKEEFIKFLGINGVSIFSFHSEEEFLEELENV